MRLPTNWAVRWAMKWAMGRVVQSRPVSRERFPRLAGCQDISGATRSRESGYALLLALFMMAAMVIASMAVFTDVRTLGRRDREDQMIWRGNQMVRAVRLYYRRTGHYPQNLDDLQKGVANIHFLRPEALRDPMNTDEDGNWRFIYTNPSGQIIGSVKYATMQQMAILDLYSAEIASLKNTDQNSDSGSDSNSGQDTTGPGAGSTGGCPPGTLNTNQAAVQSSGGAVNQLNPSIPSQSGSQSQFSASPLPTFSLGPTQTSSLGQGANAGCAIQVPGMPGMSPGALQGLLQMKPTGPVDSPVIGGFLVGVGSTVDRSSVKVYNGGKKYKEWEFIFNPIEDQARAVQQGLAQGGAPGLLGMPGNGLPGPATTTSGGIGTSPIQAPPTQPQPNQDQQEQ